MKELMFDNGNLSFEINSEILGFENKLINALQIYGVECFYNIANGLNFDIISSNQSNYKLQHIKAKILEWFSDEIDTLEFKNIRIVNKILKVTILYSHKTLGKIESEVTI